MSEEQKAWVFGPNKHEVNLTCVDELNTSRTVIVKLDHILLTIGERWRYADLGHYRIMSRIEETAAT